MTERDEFFSFEEALGRLRLKEEELKRLVSEGEIRAFRDGETMKLRRTDVDELRRELMGGDVVDLDDASDDELVLADEYADPGMATEELSTADTLLGDEIEELDELDEFDELEEEVEDGAEDAEEGGRRRAPAAPAEPIAPLALAGIFATTILMILIFPVLKNHNASFSHIANSIAGIFIGEEASGEAAGGADGAAAAGGAADAGAADAGAAPDPFAGEAGTADGTGTTQGQ